MLMKYFLNRVLSVSFPLSISLICYKISLWNKVIFDKGSQAILTNFEGHNTLQAGSSCVQCDLGLCTYIGSNTKLFKTKIGHFCSIADSVFTGFGTHPTKNFVTTFPSFYYETTNLGFSFFKQDFQRKSLFNMYRYVDSGNRFLVEIGNDVWIGSHVLIMDGVKIGDGAIVAAGAVVTKDVLPYTIVGGVPAKHIRNRFSDVQKQFLLEFKWWNRSFSWIKQNYMDFQDIDLFCSKYDDK